MELRQRGLKGLASQGTTDQPGRPSRYNSCWKPESKTVQSSKSQNLKKMDIILISETFYSRAAASLMMVWVGIVLALVQETIVSQVYFSFIITIHFDILGYLIL